LTRWIDELRRFLKKRGLSPGLLALLSTLAALYLNHRRHRLKASRADWRRHTDLSVVQAVLMSTERFQELGRVEKRTLFIKSISEVFKNEYIRENIMEAAQRVSKTGETFFVKLLEDDDKWDVLTVCQNQISSLFAPYHIFFNEASRTQSYYRSAWYCFTLTCHRTEGHGRFFITPSKPVGRDRGMLRIRIVLVSEKELRAIASGTIEPPASGFFSSRHEGRWEVLNEFADLFARQLERREEGLASLTSLRGLRKPSLSHSSEGSSFQDINELAEHAQTPRPEDNQAPRPEDNQFLRVHIPFPSCKPLPDPEDKRTSPNEIGAQDVVLFE